MKLFKVLCAIIFLTVLSCQIEDDVQLEQNTLIETSEFKATITPLGEPWESWDSVDFKRSLNGIGNLIARTIIHDADAEAEFKQLMLLQGNVVDVSMLLNPKNSRTDAFYEAFQEQFYLFTNICPGGGSLDPYPDVEGNGLNGFTSFNDYILHITKQHCLEIYTPFNYNDGSSSLSENYVITAAHPLNDLGTTNAWRYPNNGQGCDGLITVSDGSAENSDGSPYYYNLIIVRPEPGQSASPLSIYCEYPVYDSINFTDWFN